jgi:hypothetical protein
MESLVSEKEIETALEKLAIEEEKLDDAIATEQQEALDTTSFIRNKSSISQSTRARNRRRFVKSGLIDEKQRILY